MRSCSNLGQTVAKALGQTLAAQGPWFVDWVCGSVVAWRTRRLDHPLADGLAVRTDPKICFRTPRICITASGPGLHPWG